MITIVKADPFRMREDGYIIERSAELRKTVAVRKVFAAALGAKSFSKLDIQDALVTVFNHDSTRYLGLLRALASSIAVTELATSPSVKKILRKLGLAQPTLTTPPVLHVTSPQLLVEKTLRSKMFTPWHQDIASTKGGRSQLVFWLPLWDVGETDFPIVAVPGSHRKGVGESVQDGAFQRMAKPPASDSARALTVRAGEKLVFSSYLAHRTAEEGGFRVAVSFRVDDLQDNSWRSRDWFNPFVRKKILEGENAEWEVPHSFPSYIPREEQNDSESS